MKEETDNLIISPVWKARVQRAHRELFKLLNYSSDMWPFLNEVVSAAICA